MEFTIAAAFLFLVLMFIGTGFMYAGGALCFIRSILSLSFSIS